MFRNNKAIISVFCDTSCDEKENKIGLGAVIVGRGNYSVESNYIYTNIPDPLLGELLAVAFSLENIMQMLKSEDFQIADLERVIIYSDCDIIKRLLSRILPSKDIYVKTVEEITDLLEQLTATYPQIAFKVKYTGRHKKIAYYKAAHNLARKAIDKIT